MGLSFGGESFTCVGNAAPPRPTMPASRMAPSSPAGSSTSPTGASDGSHSSRPSFPITTDATRRPPATTHGCMPLTLPETGACTAALTYPSGAPTFCPMYTRSPAFTSGLHGAPTCCKSGTTASSGAGMSSTAFAPVMRFSSSPSRGCTPRRKVNIFPNVLSSHFRARKRCMEHAVSHA